VALDRPRQEDGDRLRSPDTRPRHGADLPFPPNAPRHLSPDAPSAPDRAEYVAEYRSKVDEVYRRHAIDTGCDRVRETEKTIVTPAMRRIESEDPDRHLVGLDHCLKGKGRLTEKIDRQMEAQPELSYQDAFASVKDAIRYTFQYRDDRYAEGVHADCERLKAEGFELVELRNSWSNAEYKGINSRWRVPDRGQLFEVQFHTQASFEAKQETHSAYEKIRNPATPKAERDELKNLQCAISARIPTPRGATDIPDYP
jgi:hypothetical protein